MPESHMPPVLRPVVMRPWPFLFCQKPIVKPPVTPPHTVTVTTEEVVVVVLPETPAWLLYATQMSFWIAIVRE